MVQVVVEDERDGERHVSEDIETEDFRVQVRGLRFNDARVHCTLFNLMTCSTNVIFPSARVPHHAALLCWTMVMPKEIETVTALIEFPQVSSACFRSKTNSGLQETRKAYKTVDTL
jgi:hypothetical protein